MLPKAVELLGRKVCNFYSPAGEIVPDFVWVHFFSGPVATILAGPPSGRRTDMITTPLPVSISTKRHAQREINRIGERVINVSAAFAGFVARHQ
jgi:hypothetical protein